MTSLWDLLGRVPFAFSSRPKRTETIHNFTLLRSNHEDFPHTHSTKSQNSTPYLTPVFIISTNEVMAPQIPLCSPQKSQKQVFPRDNKAIAAWCTEANLLINLSLPTVLINVSAIIPQCVVISFVGIRYGDAALSGMTLGFSTMYMIYMSVITGLLSASDTLSPQAFGLKKYDEVGVIALRSLIVSLVYFLIMLPLVWLKVESILLSFGQDEGTAETATLFLRLSIPSIPFYIVYSVVWKFFSAQEIVYPVACSSFLSSCIFLPMVLYLFGPSMSFEGAMLCVDMCYVVQVVILFVLIYMIKPQRPETWSGSFWKNVNEALRAKPMLYFCRLALGGVLSTSEWWFWEVMTLIAGNFGVVSLAAHAIPTQFLTIACTIAMSFGIAFNVRIGSTLAVNPEQAKHLCLWCYIVGITISAALSLWFYHQQPLVTSMFTNDDDVLALCTQIWPHVSIYTFHVCIFIQSIGIVNALGFQWTLGVLTVAILWVLALPAIYFGSVVRHGGLVMIWKLLYLPYFVINVLIAYICLSANFEQLSLELQRRERTNSLAIERNEETDTTSTYTTSFYCTSSKSEKAFTYNGYGALSTVM